jgi:hypothetical protein
MGMNEHFQSFPPATQRFYTLSGVAQFYGANFLRLENAAKALGLVPAMSLDLVPYFNSDQIGEILDYLQTVDDANSGTPRPVQVKQLPPGMLAAFGKAEKAGEGNT